MTQADRARAFASLHHENTPLILTNIWDAGGAQAVATAGARAIATGSWSIAAAHGFDDGQAMPLNLALTIIARIVHSVDLPVTVDFEGGYAEAPDAVAANVARVIETGAVGINFEDQVIGGEGLHPVAEQTLRLAAIRRVADAEGVPLFLNARTDVFLKAKPEAHATLVPEALARAAAYADAGADGFFVPGLADPALIREVAGAAGLPVNIMVTEGAEAVAAAAELPVARISMGPAPYLTAMDDLAKRARGA